MGHEHLLIVPGQRTERIEEKCGKTYLISSPLVSKTSRYRALLNLNAVEEILEREKPSVIESSDPYQIAWKAIASGEALRIPVVGFYHSHFPEAYLRTTAKFLGQTATDMVMEISKYYVRSLYNHFSHTFVPSAGLAHLLASWGVDNVILSELGVDTEIFKCLPDKSETRADLGIPEDQILLLYVGRLAAEKNVKTLFGTFEQLQSSVPKRFHLLVVGDGRYRDQLLSLRDEIGGITWMRYCSEQELLAKIYRAADLFVHPGIQETFGLVTLESQACGTPVVGIHGSYMDRIIFGDQTHWAAENSAESLAAAVLNMSRTNLETSGAKASRKVIERYSWQNVFGRMFGIYEEMGRNRR
jgi:alpha-1,6-mannosyltransferase